MIGDASVSPFDLAAGELRAFGIILAVRSIVGRSAGTAAPHGVDHSPCTGISRGSRNERAADTSRLFKENRSLLDAI
jgi:hypothetical protein